jgi:hypothetical protein
MRLINTAASNWRRKRCQIDSKLRLQSLCRRGEGLQRLWRGCYIYRWFATALISVFPIYSRYIPDAKSHKAMYFLIDLSFRPWLYFIHSVKLQNVTRSHSLPSRIIEWGPTNNHGTAAPATMSNSNLQENDIMLLVFIVYTSRKHDLGTYHYW